MRLWSHGDGQYDKNCYTTGKLLKIFKRLDFEVTDQVFYKWPRGDCQIIKMITKKN